MSVCVCAHACVKIIGEDGSYRHGWVCAPACLYVYVCTVHGFYERMRLHDMFCLRVRAFNIIVCVCTLRVHLRMPECIGDRLWIRLLINNVCSYHLSYDYWQTRSYLVYLLIQYPWSSKHYHDYYKQSIKNTCLVNKSTFLQLRNCIVTVHWSHNSLLLNGREAPVRYHTTCMSVQDCPNYDGDEASCITEGLLEAITFYGNVISWYMGMYSR